MLRKLDKTFKFSRLTLICLLLLIILCLNPNAASLCFGAEWQNKVKDYDQLRENFQQPPLWYAPHTFWYWDAPLDCQLSASIAKEMTTQRLNPGYAHARHSGAPDEPYPLLPVEQWLSPLWFECFGAALKEAENARMTLGYCDEYWWPSGQAAGRVLQAHPELEAKSLQWERQEIFGPAMVQIPASKFSVGGRLSESALIIPETLTVIGEGQPFSWNVPNGRWVIYSYNLFHHPGIDDGKVNYLDPKLMDVFIPIAHQSYKEHFGEKLGKMIPGVFVDNEGDFGWRMAWSEYLAQQYMEMKGRDIRLWMPLLTEKDEQGFWAKARYDWFDVVSDVYSRNYLGRLSDWLEKHGMYYISNLWEESLMFQTRAVGDFMRAQRAVTLPGNDCLQMKSQQVHDFKETQSVCEFEDRPFMSEIMGVAGWEQTPVQMKKTINSITAWGVNHVVSHGINMNRKLETIPYPADWFTENPYWRYLHLWTDFTRRAAFVNRQGRLVADILLINPLESVWALSDGYFDDPDGNRWNAKVIEINSTYSAAMDVLSRNRLDYLIADSYYMEKAVVVSEAGKPRTTSKAKLSIGDHSFSAIVLPPMVIVSRPAAKKIIDFAQAGGTVVVLGQLPQGSPERGAFDPLIVEQMEHLSALPSVVDLAGKKEKMELLPQTLNKRIPPQVRIISGEFPLLISHRRIAECDFYWLANNQNTRQECTISLREGKGLAEIWDCETGSIRPLTYKKNADRSVCGITLEPCEAFWLVFNPHKSPLPMEKEKTVSKKEIVLTGPWQLSLPEANHVQVSSVKTFISSNNTITQKFLSSDYDDSKWIWSSIVGTIRLLDTWHASLLYIPDSYCRRFYRYTFDLPDHLQHAFVNINADNSFRFWVNGHQIRPGPHVSNLNKADLHPVTSCLQKGSNVLAVEVTNNPGYGLLIVQGLVELKNGASFEILTNSKWKESKSASPGWQNPGFDDSVWTTARLASSELSQKEISPLRRPQIIVSAEKFVWRRINVPPWAKQLVIPALSKQARIWLNGRPASLPERKITLPEATKLLVINTPAGQAGLTNPIEFPCQGSAAAGLGSWFNLGLQNFTGFVDYETFFELTQTTEKMQLDLGKVLYMAEVWINDKPVGERLWPPFKFDVTKFVHPGVNKLRIHIGNLMVNKMMLKNDLGKLRTWGWQGTPPLTSCEAGLFGPVKLSLEK